MKKTKRIRRQIFVLTLEEKKAIACVLGAFVLGLATMHYRATHPRPPPPLTPREEYAAKKAARANTSRAHAARRQAAAAAEPRPTAAPGSDDDGDREE